MTDKARYKGIIIGSFILFLLSLDDSVKTKAHIKRLRKPLLDINKKEANLDLIDIADTAWTNVLHKSDNPKISLSITIESLAFSFSEEMEYMFGSDILEIVSDYAEKEAVGNVNDYAKDSYKVADKLRDELRDLMFKYEEK